MLLGHCWRAAAVAIIVAGFTVGAARLLLPAIGAQLRPQLQSWLSEQLGMPVEVAGLRLAWVGTGPALRLEGVRVQGADAAPGAIELGRIVARLDLLASLLHGRLQPGWLQFRGSRLILQRAADGRLRLPGSSRTGAPTADLRPDVVAAWIGKLPRAELVDGELTILDPTLPGGRDTIRDIAAALDYGSDAFRVGVDLQLPERYGNRLRLLLQSPGGDPVDPLSWPLSAYLVADGLEAPAIASQMQSSLPAQEPVNLRLWARAASGKLLSAHGIAADPIGGVGVRFQLEPTASGWTLRADQLHEQPMPAPAPLGSLAADLDLEAGKPSALRLVGRDLALDALSKLAARLPLDSPLAAMLVGLQPQGLAKTVELSWTDSSGTYPDRLQFSLLGEGLALRAYDRFPGISGMDLRVEGSEQNASAVLGGDRVILDFPRLFRAPLPAISVNGAFDLRREGQQWSLASSDLRLRNTDIDAHARAYAQGSGAQPPQLLDLQLSFGDLPLARARHYFPVGIMKPRLLRWLDDALVAGRVPAGVLLFRGDPADFPFARAQGTFLAQFGVEDAILDYHPLWPRAEELVGELNFTGTGFHGVARAAHLVGAEAHSATLGVDRFRDPELSLQLQSRSGVEPLRSFIDASPLSPTLGRTLADLNASGPASLMFGLKLPLKKARDFAIDGVLKLEGARISAPQREFALTEMRGPLRFTRNRLDSNGVDARWRDLPVRLTAEGENREQGFNGVFEMRGESDLVALAGVSLGPISGRISGASPWLVRARLASGETPVLELESDLQGVKVDLPAPLGKAATERRPLSLRIAEQVAQRSQLDLRLSGVGQASAIVSGSPRSPELLAASVRFGEGAAEPVPESGLTITGRLPALTPEHWLALVPDGLPTTESKLPLRRLDLAVDELRWGSLELAAVRFAADPERWRVQIDDQWIRGWASGDFRGGGVQAELDRLWLSPALTAGQKERPPDPRRLPALQVAVADLRFQDARLGRAALSTKPNATGLLITDLTLSGRHHQLTADGGWAVSGERSSSRLSGELVTTDSGKLVQELGLRTSIDGAPGRITFDLAWPGAISSPDLGQLAGRLDVALTSGKLKQLDPGVGRVFGLVNLNELGRRLALDFRDIREKGFYFHAITGEFLVADGNAYSQNVRVTGPAARIAINGRVGLVAHDYDQRVFVTPELGSALPIAGAIAGGPVVGAALLIAGQLLKPGIDRVSRVEYRITGPWESPLIEPVLAEAAPGLQSAPRGDQ
jgi:uncharacterized protein (TIGR02099 family)